MKKILALVCFFMLPPLLQGCSYETGPEASRRRKHERENKTRELIEEMEMANIVVTPIKVDTFPVMVRIENKSRNAGIGAWLQPGEATCDESFPRLDIRSLEKKGYITLAACSGTVMCVEAEIVQPMRLCYRLSVAFRAKNLNGNGGEDVYVAGKQKSVVFRVVK